MRLSELDDLIVLRESELKASLALKNSFPKDELISQKYYLSKGHLEDLKKVQSSLQTHGAITSNGKKKVCDCKQPRSYRCRQCPL